MQGPHSSSVFASSMIIVLHHEALVLERLVGQMAYLD
jgi:hypothetical protein